MTFFLKGYRVDTDKIAQMFDMPRSRALDYKPMIVRNINRGSYKYIGTGYEPDGHINMMIVMDDGYNAAELMRTPMPPSEDGVLLSIARHICTPCVWPDYDQIFDYKTFWYAWKESGGCKVGEINTTSDDSNSTEQKKT
ncbi:hypothetical protein BDN70DRAFT_878228 [Pholiota conissans]|uniref:Uncharacterized protein n=1 Tax=Pholiota conissans TaxID=109636 RepID=A0A9P5Z4I8_9AGAR|nr:hypothetical protein BDN70DRAFT_878228 [Pholiota conissans]